METPFAFYPLTGRPFVPPHGQRWPAIVEAICGFCLVDPPEDEDDAHGMDLYWTTPDGAERDIEVFVVDCEILGSWARPILPEELETVRSLAALRLAEIEAERAARRAKWRTEHLASVDARRREAETKLEPWGM